jgi:ABC-type Fe3+-hydroxamate transport system substrate-binding protein
MKRIVTAMLLFVSLIVLTGCATVVSESKYPVTITSEPQGAKITITDDANRPVYVGSTPASVSLEAG